MRDGATQTGRAVVLIAVAVVVAVVLLHHNGSSKGVTVATTPTGATTPVVGTTSTTTKGAGNSTGTTTTVPSSSSSSTTPSSTLPLAQIKVLVLNGANFALPLATEYTTKLHTTGYATLTPNNATGKVTASAIYVITTGYTREADGLAASLGLSTSVVKTTVPTTAPLSSAIPATGANLVLVVGPDLVAKA